MFMIMIYINYVAKDYNLVVWPRLLTKVSPSQHGDGGTCDYTTSLHGGLNYLMQLAKVTQDFMYSREH